VRISKVFWVERVWWWTASFLSPPTTRLLTTLCSSRYRKMILGSQCMMGETWNKVRAKFRFSLRAKHVFFGSHHCAAVLFSQVPKKYTDLDLSLLYILILETFCKFARNNFFLIFLCLLPADMLERWPQVCHVKITFTLLPTNCFVSTTTNSTRCLVN